MEERSKFKRLKGGHVHKGTNKMDRKGIARNKQKDLPQGRRKTFFYFSMPCSLLFIPVRSQKPEYPCIIRNFLCDLDKNKTSIYMLSAHFYF